MFLMLTFTEVALGLVVAAGFSALLYPVRSS